MLNKSQQILVSIKSLLKVTIFGTHGTIITIKINCWWKENLERRSRTKIFGERGKKIIKIVFINFELINYL